MNENVNRYCYQHVSKMLSLIHYYVLKLLFYFIKKNVVPPHHTI